MTAREQLKAAIESLPNREILTAAKGYSSFVTLDVGRDTEPRPLHIWIYCCRWSLWRNDRELLDDESPDSDFGPVLAGLIGGRLDAIEMRSRQHVEIEMGAYRFELYAEMETPEDDAELVMIYLPNGSVISIAPSIGVTITPENEVHE